ncbi:DUF802 domain-containing protein [Thauera linaloolentis]|uniref:DUF802 domain-containing protein n=1 Tax=Thauera linaloolentis (strain DSM 12138 / JCM 21573 / CCUG 41526 / CIP 105981 / IAM 15112 / NBRC 102519 / 47Lol) TaxID=1123367 RepID=N6Y5Z5_THAL4|nr:DUF802 domain-containing protein [Thauera linaloolentis]ENO87020.1 hypothetical protein C666_11850 [Thauera linaloolentis 47Lol = DSM 12138]MCM8565806.1 DUF802 domain-containing protein [Thauera linaloolentis]
MNRSMSVAAFLLGMAVVVWVGAGYIGRSPLALGMTALIGLVYLAGALELLRFERATSALRRALDALAGTDAGEAGGAGFGHWLDGLPAPLRNPVRLRVEGERVGLPGPVLTPYLVGMLVLLGMLGTFLGMVMTLDGAVIALETTTDLQAIRSSLAAPVKGLGVAFGTSVAGVAASAMLGLMSALCRRERLLASQSLDSRIAGALRGASLAHQRHEAFEAVKEQARALPVLVETMQAMMAQMERQGRELHERLAAEQRSFYDDARGAYLTLAEAVDASLKNSLTESARLAGQTIQPVVADTMAGIARETAALQQRVADGVQAQLDGVSQRLDAATVTVADTWTAALARHEAGSQDLGRRLDASFAAWSEGFERRATALLASVGEAHAGLRTDLAATTAGIAQRTTELHASTAATVEARLDGLAARFDAAASRVAGAWSAALASHEGSNKAVTADVQRALQAFADTFAQRSAALVDHVGARLSALQADLAAQDAARQAAQGQALEAMAGALRDEWRQAGEQACARQQDVIARLDETARGLSAATHEQARSTIEQVSGLMRTAAEAPRAAAEVIGQLRQEVSASIARDNASLAERSRIMETLGGLLGAINHASTEQRQAIDALVASSTSALQHASDGFARRIEAESTRLDASAGQLAGGAVEVASLAEAFGLAVQLFSESNDKLMASLQRIEGALEKSMARSDEQLAYYVAQAREIIDLSLMSQQRMVEGLQRLPVPPAATGEV